MIHSCVIFHTLPTSPLQDKLGRSVYAKNASVGGHLAQGVDDPVVMTHGKDVEGGSTSSDTDATTSAT